VLDRVVRDVCDKQVVLLGEASHGDARTFEVKTELIKRLVDECRFSAVLFEAASYDFIALERALAARRATPAQLANAVGAKWSAARETEPVLGFLWDRVSAGKLRVGGLDDQISSTALFAQRELPGELAATLGATRAACEAELGRFTRWEYDVAAPYDAAARDRLLACLAEIRPRARGETAEMAAALTRFVERSPDADPAGFTARDRSMFDALRWYIARLPAGAKLIVWCHTIHAAKSGKVAPGGVTPLGSHVHAALGDRAAAIGFSALGGSYGRPRKATPIEPAPAGSLEAHAFAGAAAGDLRYLDRAQLAGLGAVPARPINYQYQTADWSTIVDGMIVIREERQPQYVRGFAPQ
jgi:erythromycin esterase-like protein